MSDRPDPRPTAAARFGWHPEPGLIGVDDTAASRPALEGLGEKAWAAALDYLFEEGLRRAMGEPTGYAELRRTYFGPDVDGPGRAPRGPAPMDAILDEFRVRLAPFQLNAWHPRTLSYFTPPPLLASIVGELLTQFTNQGVDVWHAGPSGAFVEEEVGRWLCDLVGLGPESFGVLTSGGVMANFMGMTIARDVHLAGLLGLDRPPRGRHLDGVRVYASDQAHFSIARALDELGFPPETLHLVPADERFRLRGAPVAQAIADDRARGFLPFAIAGVVGSTNTGSVDVTGELADLAGREGLWLHVDAAYGGGALLSARDAWRVPDLARADSVTIDPHKWFFQAYDIGALVVRRGNQLLETFHRSPEYYRGGEGSRDRTRRAGPARVAGRATNEGTEDPATNDGAGASPDAGDDAQLNYYQRSMEGSRRWRALKLWFSWKHLGTDGLGRLVAANIDLAAYLARRIAEAPDFEAMPREPELSVVCFRHLPRWAAAGAENPREATALDAHQDRLAHELEASGDGWLGTTRLRGSTWLRAGIVNYLATEADVERILDDLRAIAERADRSPVGGAAGAPSPAPNPPR